ncbi:MAG: hypothetical protein ABI868_21745 [Acidobacteriota bacterium]
MSVSAAPPPAGRQVHQSGGRYRLTLDACGDDWLIRHADGIGVTIADSGRVMRCHCPDAARLPLLAEIIVRRVLPRVSGFHRRLPMHGATLGDSDGAIMLLGSSGAGKSTMTAALALRLGWHIFSDDMSVLDGGPRPLVFPTLPGVSVWPPSQRALALPTKDCRPLRDRDGKVWYSPASAAPPLPQPLETVILLSFNPAGTSIEYKRLAGPSVAVMLLSQIVPFNPQDAGQIALLAAQCTQVIAKVPVYGLVYPRDYLALPDVVDAIRRIRLDAPGVSS